MGICGLLPMLKSITHRKHLAEYKGKTIAVDGYGWIHRGIYSCSEELCLGKPTDKYVNYFMERVEMLVRLGVTPYIVFDGGFLPAKSNKEEERRSSREKYRAAGIKYLEMGIKEEARQIFVKAVDVTPYMAYRIIMKLKQRKVKYIVAPYEADAQMAFLSMNNIVDAVLSEDSDCLPYGCHTVLFKLDKDNYVQEICKIRLPLNKEITLAGFSDEMFLDMCILAGCDYLPSIQGMGIKKAHSFLKKFGKTKQVIKRLRLEGKMKVPSNYEEKFLEAKMTFLYHWVYDPNKKCLVPLNPGKENNVDPSVLGNMKSYIGEKCDDIVRIAEGEINPITKMPFTSTNEVIESQGGNHFKERNGNKNLEKQTTISDYTSSICPSAPESAFTRMMQRGREIWSKNNVKVKSKRRSFPMQSSKESCPKSADSMFQQEQEKTKKKCKIENSEETAGCVENRNLSECKENVNPFARFKY